MKYVATLAALLAAAPAFAVTANGASVRAASSVTVGGINDNDVQTANAVGLPASLSSSTTSSVAQGSVSTSVRANWVSAKQGSVTMAWGWDVNLLGTGLGATVRTGQFGSPNWSYSFTTGNAAGSFNGNWTLGVNAGGTLGASGLQSVVGDGGLPGAITPAGLTPTSTNGSFSVALNPNTSYTFSFLNRGGIGAGANDFDANAVFELDWNIEGGGSNAVPEPASWAMLITGFGLVGATARRRRAVTA